MKAVVQRVSWGKVEVESELIAQIGRGLVVLCGFGVGDDESVLKPMLTKLMNLRIFSDSEGRFQHSLLDIEGELLLVPQFTLYADTRKGRRPEFFSAKEPKEAEALFQALLAEARISLADRLASGRFGADMQLSLCNSGPVTITLNYPQ